MRASASAARPAGVNSLETGASGPLAVSSGAGEEVRSSAAAGPFVSPASDDASPSGGQCVTGTMAGSTFDGSTPVASATRRMIVENSMALA